MSEWDEVADAWIAALGSQGDWGRQHVLDPAFRQFFAGRRFRNVLDIGCGEGRLCRALNRAGVPTIGVDPTVRLIEAAKTRDPNGTYVVAGAEALPFPDSSFDLAVACIVLGAIRDYRRAIAEMARVVSPGGSLLVVNLTGFTSSSPHGWIRSREGDYSFYSIDEYSTESQRYANFSNLSVRNWHRPLSAYMTAFLSQGLVLRQFEEPLPKSGEPDRRERFCRAPWYVLMEWCRPPEDREPRP